MARIIFEQRDDVRGADSMRRFLDLFDDGEGPGQGECAPPMDVLEFADRVEVVVDLPGLPAAAIRVIYAQGTLVIAGRKLPRVCEHSVGFHLAERSFGRFARAITLAGAFDAGHAVASLTAGELRIVLPRIQERRGRDITIDVQAG